MLNQWKECYDKTRQRIKSRGVTLLARIHIVKAMVFPVVMYQFKSYSRKKVDCWRIDTFELWSWRRLLRFTWTARRSNQSVLKEINPESFLEGLKQKLQYFGHLMLRAGSLGKTLMLGNIEDKRRKRWQNMRWLDSIMHHWFNGNESVQTLGDSWRQRNLEC